jgi:ribonucleoside-diphosphate reductase alpha chain
MAKFDWYNDTSKEFLDRGYLNNKTIYERIDDISNTVYHIFNDSEIKDKVKEYIELGYYVLPSPVWANVGTNKAAGISCFNSYIEDSIKSILHTAAEVGMLCKIGGGTSAYFGSIRPAGSKISVGGTTYGAVHFMKIFDVIKNTISQGSTRRGEFAAYLDISHGDIEEFLRINQEGHPLQRFPFGVCVSDEWLNSMRNGDAQKRKIWASVLEARCKTGFPYIMFSDTVNNNTVDVYKDKGMRIYSSNMCSEILLPTNSEETFVCDLIGMNLTKYDEWKNTDAVRIATYIADAVLEEFIQLYEKEDLIKRSINFAKRHRALGIGASGYHSLLQSKMIAFESMEAKFLNLEIFKHIQTNAWEASKELAERYGAPELLRDYGRRNTTLTAIAPNTSSSMIMGQHSQSVEPYTANYYIKKSAKKKLSVKNPYLEKVLDIKNHNTIDVWESILIKGGSVQHLPFLSEQEKKIFRTFGEISQKEILIQASQRQKYVDQGQSLNLMIHPNTPIKDINKLMLEAHEMGIKTLYYQLSTNAAQEFIRDILSCDNCAG